MSLRIHTAGDVIVPAYLTLLAKGYQVTKERRPSEDWWRAVGPLGEFGGSDVLEVLALVAIGEARGESWKATDADIDAFLIIDGA
jgi:hypothetical protein